MSFEGELLMAFIGNISIGTGFFPKGFFTTIFAPLADNRRYRIKHREHYAGCGRRG